MPVKNSRNVTKRLKRELDENGKRKYIQLSTVLEPAYGQRVKDYATSQNCSVSSLIESLLKEVVK